MPSDSITDYMIPLVERLSSEKWFTGHVSVCGVIPGTYSCLPTDRIGDFGPLLLKYVILLFNAAFF